MPNGTYGGVRGRETKVIGGKLQESFVFLLLDYLFILEFIYSSIVGMETRCPLVLLDSIYLVISSL